MNTERKSLLTDAAAAALWQEITPEEVKLAVRFCAPFPPQVHAPAVHK